MDRPIGTLTAGPVDVDIAWGGYYASVDEEGRDTSVFRLLDFNRDAYHASLFQERFKRLPSLRKIVRLRPFVLHVPIDARDLLHRDDLRLIGARPLTSDDLQGYHFYLEEMGFPPSEIEELMTRIIAFSQGSPMRVTLEVVHDELVISERPS